MAVLVPRLATLRLPRGAACRLMLVPVCALALVVAIGHEHARAHLEYELRVLVPLGSTADADTALASLETDIFEARCCARKGPLLLKAGFLVANDDRIYLRVAAHE